MFPSLPRKRTLERSVVALYATVSFEVQYCTAVRIWYFALALSEIVIPYYLTLSYFNYSPVTIELLYYHHTTRLGNVCLWWRASPRQSAGMNSAQEAAIHPATTTTTQATKKPKPSGMG